MRSLFRRERKKGLEGRTGGGASGLTRGGGKGDGIYRGVRLGGIRGNPCESKKQSQEKGVPKELDAFGTRWDKRKVADGAERKKGRLLSPLPAMSSKEGKGNQR